jgi:hypothetical protein
VAREVIFGTPNGYLNESLSRIKVERNHFLDYSVQAIPFQQLVANYILVNEELSSYQIGFIKCDIEGGEEDILEDLLMFALENQCKVYISFHLDWWKERKIEDFTFLFLCFKTSPSPDICEYLRKNPFGSVLFTPF